MKYLNLKEIKKVYVLEGLHSKVYVEFYEDDQYTAYITHLHVDENHRKHGIGNKTLNDAEQWARVHGFDKVMLMCESDSWMYHWYISKGYKFHSNEDEEYCWLYKKFYTE